MKNMVPWLHAQDKDFIDEMIEECIQEYGNGKRTLDKKTYREAMISMTEFLSPLLECAEPKQYEMVMHLGASAWNLAILPKEEFDYAYNQMLKLIKKGSGSYKHNKELLDYLIDRKRKEFAECNVMFLD